MSGPGTGTVFQARGQVCEASMLDGTWSFWDLKADQWGWCPVSEGNRDRKVRWRGRDWRGQDIQNLGIPSRVASWLNKQWVPQASDVFKQQRRDMVTFTRSLWLLSSGGSCRGRREAGHRGYTSPLHHIPRVSVLFLPFVFPQVLNYSGKLFLLFTDQVLVLDLETAGPSNCWGKNSHCTKKERYCLLSCSLGKPPVP